MKRFPYIALALAAPAWAAQPVSAPPAALPTALGSLMTVLLGLAVVLGSIVACAWLFRRLSGGMMGGNARLRVVSGVMVGHKERVVIVELEGEWLVLGVTGSQVNLLTKLPRPADADIGPPQPAEPFARWLQAALEKGRAASSKK